MNSGVTIRKLPSNEEEVAGAVKSSNSLQNSSNGLALTEADNYSSFGFFEDEREQLVVLCVVVVTQNGILF